VVVGLSRIYLGVHYPAQVIGGYVVGLAVPFVGMILPRYFPTKTKQNLPRLQLLFGVCILTPLAAGVALGAVGATNPGSIGGYLVGFWLGTFGEARYVRFTTQVNYTRKMVRVLVGTAMTGLLVLGSGQILFSLRLVQSFTASVIQGLTVALIVPIVFGIIERRLGA